MHQLTGAISAHGQENGWLQHRLQGTRRHAGNGNDIHGVREEDILNFLTNRPQEINLGKVYQTWFLDLVLLKGREVREVTFPRSTNCAEDNAAAQPKHGDLHSLAGPHCPGYSSGEALSTEANLMRTAVRYKVDTSKITVGVIAELSAKWKEQAGIICRSRR